MDGVKAFLQLHIDAIVATALALAAFLVSDNFREWNREAMRAHESLRDIASASVPIITALGHQHSQGRAISLPVTRAQLTLSAVRFRTDRNRPTDESVQMREQGAAAEIRERVINHSLAMVASLRDAADDVSRRYRPTLNPLPIDQFKVDRLSHAPWIISCVNRMWPTAPEPVAKALTDYSAAVVVNDPATYRARTLALSNNLKHLADFWGRITAESVALSERGNALFAEQKFVEGNAVLAGGDYELANVIVHCFDAEINALLHAMNMNARGLSFSIDQRVLPNYRRTDRNWAWVAAFIAALGFLVVQFKATNILKPRNDAGQWAS